MSIGQFAAPHCVAGPVVVLIKSTWVRDTCGKQEEEEKEEGD